MRRLVRGVAAIVVACLVLQSVAALAVMEGLSTERLTSLSGRIVKGRVISARAEWTPDGSSIETRVLVKVQETIKGETDEQEIEVVYPGGEVDGIGLQVSDCVRMNPGEEVLLFLDEDREAMATRMAGPLIHRLVGKAQGKYSIDARGQARKRGFSLKGGEPVDNDLPAAELIEKIRRFVHESR